LGWWGYFKGINLDAMLHGLDLLVQVLTTDGQITLEMVMAQISIAFQRALIAFPLRYENRGRVNFVTPTVA
jgi:hypothetical protein